MPFVQNQELFEIFIDIGKRREGEEKRVRSGKGLSLEAT